MKRFVFLLLFWMSAREVQAAPAPHSLPPQTLRQLRALLRHPLLRDAHVGVSIVALGRAKPSQFPATKYDGGAHPVLFQQDADKRFLPASNLKLFTAALALEELGPEHTFETRVLGLDNGLVAPDFDLVGGGDPALATADLEELALQAVHSGIAKVGSVTGDGSAFGAETFGGRYPDGWTLDDAIYYYGAEIGALALDRNQVDVTLKGAATPGLPATLEVSPVPAEFQIVAHVATGGPELAAKSEEELLQFNRSDAVNALGATLTISGQLAPGQVISDGVAVPNPARHAAAVFARLLKQNGVTVTNAPVTSGALLQEVAHHDSPPVRVLLQKFLKTSDNLYGEMLLRDAALYGKSNPQHTPGFGTAERAHTLLRAWLQKHKINTDELRFEDGSGLSRYNMVTPRAMTGLLAAVETLRGGESFYAALPIAGRDGTLKNRMKGTAAQDNARAKSGTFSIVSCLSGYVTTRDGNRLAVSILTNFAREGQAARRIQDRFFAVLAAS